MNRLEMHKQVILHFGKTKQLAKVSEELEELREQVDLYRDYANNIDDIKNEMADVYNMLEQLKIILDINWGDINEIQDRKMQRTLDRINKLEG